MVTAVESHTVARRSGLKYGDSILSFAGAVKESMEKPKPCHEVEILGKNLREASEKGRMVVLVIRRG